MSETTFGTWIVPESPVDIEYSMSVIEEIRATVAEGFQRLARGGIEVGGILYGTVSGRHLRIMAVREIACEHASGPTFHLSDNDRALLEAQLEREREDPRLLGMVAVGWYLSHTRSEIALQQNDLDTFNSFFPEPWQVTMVIRPGRASAMRAGFFVREAGGTVKTDQSYQDFQFPDRIAGMFDRPKRERTGLTERAPERIQERPPERPLERASQARPDPVTDLHSLAEEISPRQTSGFRQPMRPEPDYGAAPPLEVTLPAPPPMDAYPRGALTADPFPRQRKFPWTVIVILAVGVVLAIAGLRFFGPRLNAEPLGLTVSERDAQLQIQWNRASRSITGANGATIEIDDGPDKQSIALNPPQLASGNLAYVRKTADVQIRMRTTGSGGAMEEETRFLGNSSGNSSSGGPAEQITKAQRDELQDEVERLRTQNSAQTERIQRLERTLTILRSRLGITDTAR